MNKDGGWAPADCSSDIAFLFRKGQTTTACRRDKACALFAPGLRADYLYARAHGDK
jgi:hypothetical protein